MLNVLLGGLHGETEQHFRGRQSRGGLQHAEQGPGTLRHLTTGHDFNLL